MFCATAASAQEITATDVEMRVQAGTVTVSFTISANEGVVGARRNLVIEPILRSGGYRKALPSIVVRGRRSRVLDERHGVVRGTAVYVGVGESARYRASVPMQDWMRGGQLFFSGAEVACGPATEVALGVVADNILQGAKPAPVVEATKVVEAPVVPQPTTGEKLQAQYPFVAPAREFKAGNEIYAAREGSISVYFARGNRNVDRYFGNNNDGLTELLRAVRALEAAEDSSVSAIVIAGFASPEGSSALNDKLAWDRAVAVKNYLLDNTSIDPKRVKVFNGSADWEGLRELVEGSDIYQKGRILDIIADRDTRALARYQSTLEPLYKELRQAAYIKVYYDDKK